MLNAIVSSPGFALASRMAWRSDPAPVSFVFDTVKVAARSGSPMKPRIEAAKKRFKSCLLV